VKNALPSKIAIIASFQESHVLVTEIWTQAIVVHEWSWKEFKIPIAGHRKGVSEAPTTNDNPNLHFWLCSYGAYPVSPAATMALNETEAPPMTLAKEYKIVALRECPLPESMKFCDEPEKVADYFRLVVTTNPYFNPECECFAVLLLNTRRRAKGHLLISIGTLDTLLVHPREVFRGAIIGAAAAIVLVHNHPSGEPTPSEADIKVTRDLIRAGQLLKIDVLDHVIVGNPNFCSLRALGYFYT